MRVGVLTASVSPLAGGLYGVLPPLVRGLGGAGCDVRVFGIGSTDEQADSSWHGANVCICPRIGPRSFGFAPRLHPALDEAQLDVLHTHGLWMYPSVAAVRWRTRWRRPLVVSPHGMLDPWAVHNAGWKKRMASHLFERHHLGGAACLHALNEAEYRAIRSFGLRNPVAIIPNGIELPGEMRKPVTSDRDRVLLFLGRLHPKKGLANLLRAWARAQNSASRDGYRWRLVIAGWDQAGHESELRRLSDELALGATVSFSGPQFGERKVAAFTHADAFVLPSLSEGLPIAVLEAWSYALPVLMTPECNLQEGFASGAAISLGRDVESIEAQLLALQSLSDQLRRDMGLRGRRLVEAHFNWPEIAESMSRVYRWLTAGGERPPQVRVD